MTTNQELVDAAVAQMRRRWPEEGEAGAAAVRTTTGEIFTSVALDNLNPSVTLCHETGAIIQAHTLDLKVAASVCVYRPGTGADPVVLSPCGICRERLALWGPEVEVAVADSADPTRWHFRPLSQVHVSYWGRQFPEESGWAAIDPA